MNLRWNTTTKHNLVVLIMTLTGSVLASGCTTATYGAKPAPVADQQNTFTFKIFTGGFSGGNTADGKAEQEFEKFRKENGYQRYTIVDKQYETFPSGFRYKVKFFK